jgi:hypothetical protein
MGSDSYHSEHEDEEHVEFEDIVSRTLQNTFISTDINIIREKKNERDYQKRLA